MVPVWGDDSYKRGMMKLEYLIDGKTITADANSEQAPFVGDDIVLTDAFDDLTKSQPWYEQGYAVFPLFDDLEFARIKAELASLIERRLHGLGVNMNGFELGRCHHYVDDESHCRVVGMARELFPRDFGFSTDDVLEKMRNALGEPLGYENPVTKAS